jgi:hypothetical protein
MVAGNKVEIIDQGSSNGTFVNGVLAKRKVVKNQDKISIGPFVLQLIAAEAAPIAKRPLNAPPQPILETGMAPGQDAQLPADELKEPTSLVGKLKKRFDDMILPMLFDMHERQDWATIATLLFGIFIVLNLGFSVYPILESSKKELLQEAGKRAEFIANQIADLNQMAIQDGKETLLNVDFADKDVSVKEAVIINLEGRIMAPSTRQNQMFDNPYVLRQREKIQKQQSEWKPKKMQTVDEIIAVTPIMVLHKTRGINVPGALAVVVMSKTGVTLDPGTVGVVYFETLMTSAIVGIIFLYLIYNLTMKPIVRLNDDLDNVLKGAADQVEKRYRGQQMARLIDSINAAVARIPKTDVDAGFTEANSDNEQQIVDNMLQVFTSTASTITQPCMLLDGERRVKFMNAVFEEMTGIHLAQAQGDVLSNVSRDESFSGLVQEMTEKAARAGADGVDEDYEFNSGIHKLNCKAIMGTPGKVEAYLLIAQKA